MAIRDYSTGELCPNCHVNIFDELCARVFTEGGTYFEIECPSCNHMLAIEVQPVPAFGISMAGGSPTLLAADGAGTLGIDPSLPIRPAAKA